MKNKNAVAFGLSLLSLSVSAANHVADGRGNGMGNTGIASGEYLVAPFYNPALAAISEDSDDFAILIPAGGVKVRDTDSAIELIDDVKKTFEKVQASPSTALLQELNGQLDSLSGHKPLTVSGNLGIAVAIPTQVVSANVFSSGYVEVIGITNVASKVSDSLSDTSQRVQDTDVDLVAFGYTEVGVAIAKHMNVGGQQFSFGVTPKFQKLTTYSQSINVNDFKIDEYNKGETTDSAFNLDLGAVWLLGNHFRGAIVIKDILKQSITTDTNFVYELSPQITVGAAYISEFFTLAADADVTAQTRFVDVNDDTQFVRFGAEANAWDWAQLRLGYEIDTKNTVDNSVTFGLGFSPFDVVNIDLAGSYAGNNQFGASGSLAFTF
ncbi:conjugal transfer protein TraF [Vibrio sp. S9_S30]|uniref:conjugal transfer protein TraF n=1 Tax=Vibrio sp. S9_S30 TaxID=2720226 RepID=UPI0016812D72|nr:conjugal transfer protein TraF [Vibrio sp. S9_S30]MBD1558748.1 conjugal transfer protein TraF [Vibrio sp. S9_S30]